MILRQKSVTAFFCIAGMAMLAACTNEPGEPSQTDKALEELRQLYDAAREQAPEDPVAWAREDLQRQGDWEYRVVSLPAADTEAIEAQLNEYGKDRWEVFWVREEEQVATVFMKRSARSYLRSVPLSDLGKAVSGGDSE